MRNPNRTFALAVAHCFQSCQVAKHVNDIISKTSGVIATQRIVNRVVGGNSTSTSWNISMNKGVMVAHAHVTTQRNETRYHFWFWIDLCIATIISFGVGRSSWSFVRTNLINGLQIFVNPYATANRMAVLTAANQNPTSSAVVKKNHQSPEPVNPHRIWTK